MNRCECTSRMWWVSVLWMKCTNMFSTWWKQANPFHFCSQYYEPELGNLKDLLRKPNRFIITIIKIYLSIFRPHCQCFQKTFEIIYGGIIIVGFTVFHRHFGHLRSQYLEHYVFFSSFHLVIILGIWSDRWPRPFFYAFLKGLLGILGRSGFGVHRFHK